MLPSLGALSIDTRAREGEGNEPGRAVQPRLEDPIDELQRALTKSAKSFHKTQIRPRLMLFLGDSMFPIFTFELELGPKDRDAKYQLLWEDSEIPEARLNLMQDTYTDIKTVLAFPPGMGDVNIAPTTATHLGTEITMMGPRLTSVRRVSFDATKGQEHFGFTNTFSYQVDIQIDMSEFDKVLDSQSVWAAENGYTGVDLLREKQGKIYRVYVNFNRPLWERTFRRRHLPNVEATQ